MKFNLETRVVSSLVWEVVHAGIWKRQLRWSYQVLLVADAARRSCVDRLGGGTSLRI